MSWSVEIHHLDLKSVGDATIIVARNSVSNTVKTVLIDGGKSSAAPIINGYLKEKKIDWVDVIAVTHYDDDHLNGITKLLEMDDTTSEKRYDNSIIYDSGETFGQSERGTKGNYQKYLDAISLKKDIKRVTKNVNSFDIVNYIENREKKTSKPKIPRGKVDSFLDPHWLINKEIMWGNGLENTAFRSAPPTGAPQIICIAANKYVLQSDGVSVEFISDYQIYDGPRREKKDIIASGENSNRNAKSLGFLLKFNNFKYYVGGDLESSQEDGLTKNPNSGEAQQGLMYYLNTGNNMSGRVLAMKASHHGSDLSSSRDFINRLRPSAAFISTGTNNKHEHPGKFTVNVLDGYVQKPPLRNSDYFHPPAPPQPFFRPVKNYLTGYQNLAPLQSFGGDSSEVAGKPLTKPGHIVLNVSENQSQLPVEGQAYRGIKAAAATINNLLGISLSDDEIDGIAKTGATFCALTAVAAVIKLKKEGTKDPLAGAMREIALLGDDRAGLGIISNKKKNTSDLPSAISKRLANLHMGTDLAVNAILDDDDVKMQLEDSRFEGDKKLSAELCEAADFAAAALDRDKTGACYAAAAAIAAISEGASESQAVILGITAGVTSQASLYDSTSAGRIITNGAIAARCDWKLAALAGAVAAATYMDGLSSEIGNCVSGALNAVQPPLDRNAIKKASEEAQAAATLPASMLFNVNLIDSSGKGVTRNHFG